MEFTWIPISSITSVNLGAHYKPPSKIIKIIEAIESGEVPVIEGCARVSSGEGQRNYKAEGVASNDIYIAYKVLHYSYVPFRVTNFVQLPYYGIPEAKRGNPYQANPFDVPLPERLRRAVVDDWPVVRNEEPPEPPWEEEDEER